MAEKVRSLMMDPANLRVLKGRLIAALATKLTEEDVDFRGILVRSDLKHGLWEVRVEFEPPSDDKLEHYQELLTVEALDYDFEPVMRFLARSTAAERRRWLKTRK